jgi:transposase
MEVRLSADERAAVAAARAQERRARVWRRYRALELLDDGQAPPAVAAALGCCPASVYNWAAAWRRDGLAGLAEGPHPGMPRRLGGPPEGRLDALLAGDPQAAGYQASGWTVPLLQTELAKHGPAVSQRTVRRALHRRGGRWKRPKYVLGRPDPDYAEKKGRWRRP